jgi:asparagine synthase (glutamine-hydrolysing)
MPGIAGIFSRAPDAPLELARMLSSMLHDPEYHSGKTSIAELGCHVAWTCHPGSFADGMPRWNATRDICLVFAGEDFADEDDLAALRRRGLPATAGEAGYLISMYQEFGPSFAARLNGRFCGVLIDLRRGLAFLFNDRYGASRIYWRQTDSRLYFASEAKALLRIFPDCRRLDTDAVAQTYSAGCVLQNRTLFSGLSLLPPASCWTIDRPGQVKRRTYFSPSEWEHQPALDADAFYDRFKAGFTRLLPRYFRGPGPCGMSLTGGLDGRMIMAWARQPPGALPCYSFGGAFRDCADVRIARRIARHCRQPHTTIVAGDRFLADFPALASRSVYISDGTMDVSGAVEVFANRAAREIAPNRITGNYGSEIVRGNVAFRPRRVAPEFFEPSFQSRISQAEEVYRAERAGRELSFIAFKQVSWHHHARLAVEQSQLTMRSPFLDNELVSLMYRAPATALPGADPSLRLIQDGDAALARIPTDRGRVIGPHSLVDRTRILLQEFAVRAEYVYDYGMPQWLARADRVASPLHLERLFLGRHKFYHFRTWYRHALASYVKEVLLDRRALERCYVRPDVLRRIVDEHVTGRGNHTLDIHRALTLELTHRELLDRWTSEECGPRDAR